MTSKLMPEYYKGQDGKDLFDRFEEGLLSPDEVRGFYKGNIIKYVTRYGDKNGTEDLKKAGIYLKRLETFETPLRQFKDSLKALGEAFAKVGRSDE